MIYIAGGGWRLPTEMKLNWKWCGHLKVEVALPAGRPDFRRAWPLAHAHTLTELAAPTHIIPLLPKIAENLASRAFLLIGGITPYVSSARGI